MIQLVAHQVLLRVKKSVMRSLQRNSVTMTGEPGPFFFGAMGSPLPPQEVATGANPGLCCLILRRADHVPRC
jgi:hypothetical protein